MVFNTMDRSAGIILVKMMQGIPHILGLRVYKSYDLPKGKIEEGESELEAALRETAEEAGIADIKFEWGYDTVKLMSGGKKKKQVTLFIASTQQDATIRKNPETGRIEHHGSKWLSFDEAERMLHTYLRPAVTWARERVVSVETIEEFIRVHIKATE